MKVIGIRCSNKDFSYAIVSGTKSNPTVIEKHNIKYPQGYGKQYLLKWFYQESEKIINDNKIKQIAIKGTEGIAMKGKNFATRVEFEAVIFLLSADLGIKRIIRKMNSTIAKDLGLKGKSSYLSSKLDTSIIDGFEKFNNKFKDAIHVAWSELPIGT